MTKAAIRIVIMGAGPAGASLALLLSRQGHHVTLLESRPDFSREFRGEVLMPSGIKVLDLITPDWKSQVAHNEQSTVTAYINQKHLFTTGISSSDARPIAVSQPDLLNYLVQEAKQHGDFDLKLGARVRSLVRDDHKDRVTGVVAFHDNQELEIPCDLLIGADGRNSYVRRALKIPAEEASLPMDVVWFKLPPLASQQGFYAYVGRAHLAISYNAWDGQLQLAWIILKGTFGDLRQRGVEAWASDLAEHVQPELSQHILDNLDHMQKPSLLNSESDRVQTWSKDGALLIGDAAHTVSPVGAQGINLALRDAYIAAKEIGQMEGGEDVLVDTIDRTCQSIESQRVPEIKTIQSLQARPPRIALSQAWWGEPVRRSIAALMSVDSIRNQAARAATPFVEGVTDLD